MHRKRCRAQFIHLVTLLFICKKFVFALPPELVRPNVDKLRVAVSNAAYVAGKIPFVTLEAMAVIQKLTRKAAVVATLVHIPDSSQSTVTRSYYHCLLRVRRLLKISVQTTDAVHAYVHYIDPPDYWQKSYNIPFFLKPATLVYKSSFPKDVMMKALKEYSALAETQDVQMVAETSTGEETGSVSNGRSEDLNKQPNSDLKPKKSVASKPVFKIPSSEGLRKKRSISLLPKTHITATESDSQPASKRLCENKVSTYASQLFPSTASHYNKTGQCPATSPLLKSLSAASTPQRKTSFESEPVMPSTQSDAPLSQVSELAMCAPSPQENTHPPDVQSPQSVSENPSILSQLPNREEEKPARARVGQQKQSSTACHAALSKEARKASFDKRRSLGIAAALAEGMESNSAKESESELKDYDSDESSDRSDSEDESDDDEYDNSSDVKIDGEE